MSRKLLLAASVMGWSLLHAGFSLALPNNLLAGDMALFSTDPVSAAPSDIKFIDTSGKINTLADFQGSVVVVNLWATWCAPCREEMPDLNALQHDYSDRGLVVLALNEDRASPDRGIKFLQEIDAVNLSFYRDYKRSAMAALGVRGLPATVIFDQNGEAVGRLMGPADWNGPYARAIFDYLLGQKR